MTCKTKDQFFMDRFADNLVPDDLPEAVQMGMNAFGVGMGLKLAGMGVAGSRFAMYNDVKLAVTSGAVGGGGQYGGMSASYVGAAAGLASAVALSAVAGTAAVGLAPALAIMAASHIIGSAAQALYETEWQDDQPTGPDGCPFPDDAPPPSDPHGNPGGGAGSRGGGAFVPGSGGPLNPRWDPLVIDLIGDGLDFVSVAGSTVQFDLNGDGFRETAGWIGAGTGLVIRDINNNGAVDDAGELIGNAEHHAYEVLQELDGNSDGVIDASDAVFSELRVWQDLNQNGLTDAGELKTLGELGIERLQVAGAAAGVEMQGNLLAFTGTAGGAGSTTFQTGAVYFSTDMLLSEWEAPTGFTINTEVYGLPNLAGYGLVKDLDAAMSLDAVLLDMVEQLVLDSDTITPNALRARFEAIVLRWAGAETVDPESRGHWIDAQRLAVVESFFGQGFFTTDGVSSTTDPMVDQVAPINMTYDNIIEVMLTRFVTQIAASRLGLTGDDAAFISSPFLALAAAGYNAESDMLEGNLIPTLLLLKQFAPAGGIAQLDYLGMALSTFRGAEGEYLAYMPGYADILFDCFDGADSVFLYEFVLAIHNADGVMGRSAGAGRDVLWGHQSGDMLDGGAGADTYVYVGGEIVIRDGDTYGSSVDRVLIDPAYSAADLRITRAGNDVVLSFAGQAGGIRLVGQDGPFDGGVEQIVFADGALWTRADLMAAYFASVGTAGDDVISGFYMSADVIDGGAGNDTLSGRSGSDTFVFGRGYGSDVIAEIHQTYHNPLNIEPGDDVVAFNADTRLSDLRVHVVGNDLIIAIDGAADVLAIWRGASGDDWHQVEGFTFAADGFVSLAALRALAEPVTQRVVGSGASDVVDLAVGDERVTGRYDVTETYTYARGDGFDVIASEGLSGAGDDRDVVRFTDIASTEVRFLRTGDNLQDLVIEILGVDGGRLVLRDQFALGPFGEITAVGALEFADDVTLTLPQIVARMLEADATSGADVLRGGVGDDVIEGGTGDDEMRGGRGSDTYAWTSGEGHDLIVDTSPRSEGGADVLVLHGVDPAQVRVQRGEDFGGAVGSLRLSFADQAGSILIQGQTGGAVERVVFDDASVWDAAELALRMSGGFGEAVTRTGTGGDDILVGTIGNDVFDGGDGDDRLEGGRGSDLYRFGAGSGDDTIDDDGGHPSESADGVELVGLSPGDVVLGRTGDDLFIRIVATGETLTVLGHFSLWNADTSVWSVERLLFASGEVWDLTRINLEGGVYRGTDAGEEITAYGGGDNVFIGHGGDDLLRDWWGGDDAYLWSAGDGNDEIREDGGFDTVRLQGVDPAGVVLARSGDDLTITMTGTGEVVTVYRHFSDWAPDYAIERIVFDAVIWDAAYIAANAPMAGTPDTDYLYGGEGDDILVGAGGDDELMGGSGSDTYRYAAGDGSDLVREHAGEPGDHDVLELQGLTAADVTVSADEDGNVLLHLPDGSIITLEDQLEAVLNGDPGEGLEEIRLADDTWSRARIAEKALSGGAVEARFGGGGADVLAGGAGVQVVYGLAGDDVLSGGGGDDRLIAGEGNDDLSGGAGTDVLQGGEGSDTYHFDRGDGADVIADNGRSGIDTLVLGAGLSPGDVEVSRDGDAFILDFGPGDTVRLDFGLHPAVGAGIDEIVFADGAVWSREDLAALWLAQAATAGDDIVEGFSTDDVITGGAGQDGLYGGAGDDVYLFNPGDGDDRIQDQGGVDRIVLAAGIDPSGVTVSRGDNGDIILDFGGGDRLTIEGGLEGWDGAFQDDYGVERIEFANAVVWTKADLAARLLESTAGNDQIVGLVIDDILTGGAGRDLFVASGGADRITDFSLIDDRVAFDRAVYATGADVLAAAVQVGADVVIGSGADTITLADVLLGDLTTDHFQITGYDETGATDAYAYELGWGDLVLDEDAASALDTLTLGAGVTSAGVQVIREGSTAVLRLPDGAEIRIAGQFADWAWGDGAGIEQVVFADGGVWSREDLAALSLAQATTAGDDVVEGFSTDDVIAGGAGQDGLYGGAGDDAYLFNPGDGDDLIQDDGGVDRIVLGAGIDPSAVTVSRGANGEVVLDFGGGDRLTVQNGLLGWDGVFQDDYGVERIEFANAVVWTKADLAARLLESTAGNDQIVGFAIDDVLTGGAGRDLFVASGGADRITDFSLIDDRVAFDRAVYATGADVLAAAVQVGADVVIGSGADTITLADVLLGDLTTDHFQITGYDETGATDAYAYELGWGDLVLDESGAGLADALVFGAGVAPTGIAIERDDTTAVVVLQDGARIRIAGQFADWAWSDGAGVETFSFEGGPTWDRDDFLSAYLAGQATSGDDTVTGFNRDDLLSGGAGRDVFDFTSTWTGHDIILDFDAAEDSLLFADYRFGDGFDLLRAARQDGDDVVIVFGEDASVTLQGVSLDTLGLANLRVAYPRDWSEPPEEGGGGLEGRPGFISGVGAGGEVSNPWDAMF